MATNGASQEIHKAIKGLLYTSETDAPFEVVHWAGRAKALSAADLLALVGKKSDAQVENVSLDEFFGDLTQDQDWHDADDKQTVHATETCGLS